MAFPPKVPDTLEDDLVRLSRYTKADAEALFHALDDARCWEHIPREVPQSTMELNEQITSKLDGNRITYTVYSRNRVVGTTSIINTGELDGVEIGATQLSPKVWGSGVNKRAKKLLTTALFEAGCSWVQFCTDVRNERAVAAIRSLGTRDVGVRPDPRFRRDGTQRTSIYFRLDAPSP